MTEIIAYRIGSSITYKGKVIPKNKRLLQWQFALLDKGKSGKTKTKKHTLSFMWSVVSGKRLIYLDGVQKHFSQGEYIVYYDMFLFFVYTKETFSHMCPTCSEKGCG